MSKRLAILFASLSLCACGFIGCGDSDKGVGDKCEASDECTASDNLFCQKQAEGDESKCAEAIAKNAECINSSDVCADKDYKCAKKGGDGDDKDKLICKKSESSSAKIEDGAKCASANDVCKSEGFKCLAKGGDGDDKNDLVCKKDESGSSDAKPKAGGECDDSVDAKKCDGNDLVCEKDSEEENAKSHCKIKEHASCAAEGASDKCAKDLTCKDGDGGAKTCEKAGGAGDDKAKYGDACKKNAEAEGDAKLCGEKLACEAKGGTGADKDNLICKHANGEVCTDSENLCAAKADDATKAFECKEDSQDNTKKKCQEVSGGGEEDLDSLDVAALSKKVCEKKHSCSINTPGLDDQCNAVPMCVNETKAYYNCMKEAESCAAAMTGCTEAGTAYSTCVTQNPSNGTAADQTAINEIKAAICEKHECSATDNAIINALCATPQQTEPKCVDENKADLKCQINAECSAFEDAANLCKTEHTAYTTCLTTP